MAGNVDMGAVLGQQLLQVAQVNYPNIKETYARVLSFSHILNRYSFWIVRYLDTVPYGTGTGT